MKRRSEGTTPRKEEWIKMERWGIDNEGESVNGGKEDNHGKN
jgi:hypothetical protein